MSITIPTAGGGGGAILSSNSTSHPYTRTLTLRHVIIPLTSTRRPDLHVASAKKSFSSRSNRLDGKSRRGDGSTTTRDKEGLELDRTAQIKPGDGAKTSADVDDGYFLPKLPGDEPDFWEGEKWDSLGFFVEYMWAFGFVFAIIACGVAVATYNEGATDFKDTAAYKESIQTQDFLEEPETSNPDVFESNPTEVAPSLE